MSIIELSNPNRLNTTTHLMSLNVREVFLENYKFYQLFSYFGNFDLEFQVRSAFHNKYFICHPLTINMRIFQEKNGHQWYLTQPYPHEGWGICGRALSFFIVLKHNKMFDFICYVTKKNLTFTLYFSFMVQNALIHLFPEVSSKTFVGSR